MIKRYYQTVCCEKRELLKYSRDQKFLIIMDVFTGQMTTEVIDAYEKANMLKVNVQAKMIKYIINHST